MLSFEILSTRLTASLTCRTRTRQAVHDEDSPHNFVALPAIATKKFLEAVKAGNNTLSWEEEIAS